MWTLVASLALDSKSELSFSCKVAECCASAERLDEGLEIER
jgi:hypothetical protein